MVDTVGWPQNLNGKTKKPNKKEESYGRFQRCHMNNKVLDV